MKCILEEKGDNLLRCAECGMETARGVFSQCGKNKGTELEFQIHKGLVHDCPKKGEFYEYKRIKEQEEKNQEYIKNLNATKTWLKEQNTKESMFALDLLNEEPTKWQGWT